MAVCAALRRRAFLAAAAGAGVACLDAGNGDLLVSAESSLLKCYPNLNMDPLALARRVPAARARGAAAEDRAENVTQVEINAAESAESAEARACAEIRVDTGMAELVVFCSFFGVGQNLVCLVDFLEACFGVLVARIQVRVVFFSQLPKRFFDLIVGRPFSAPVSRSNHVCPPYSDMSPVMELLTDAPMCYSGQRDEESLIRQVLLADEKILRFAQDDICHLSLLFFLVVYNLIIGVVVFAAAGGSAGIVRAAAGRV